jgi:hypothetical protein
MLTGKTNLFCLARWHIEQRLSLESQEMAGLFVANNFILEEGKWPNRKCQGSVQTVLIEAEKGANLVVSVELEDVVGFCTK